MTDAEKLGWLVDRAEIADLIGRYSWAIDRRDWELFRTCFAPELVVDLGELGEAAGSTTSRELWVAMVAAAFDGQPQSQHIKVPVSYEIDRAQARVISFLQGKHWDPSAPDGPIHTVVGYYREGFSRTEEGWRLSVVGEDVHWNEGNQAIHDRMVEQLVAAFERGRAG